MRFVIVTGMSGAGKSSALKMLEDVGYFCIDNLPIFLVSKLAELLGSPSSEVNKIALGMDIRSAKNADKIEQALDALDALDVPYELLFMDASDEVLVKRYKETRRSHPLSGNDRVDHGIQMERAALGKARARADYIVDTSRMLIRELKMRINSIFVENEEYKNLYISIVSFGFKNGIPSDADLVFDVRFLPNPYYVDELRAKSGNDREVQDYVMKNEKAVEFLQKLIDMVRFLIPNYAAEGKTQLVIGIGCTGGKHRSVTLANALYEALCEKEAGYGLKIEHRDIEKDAIIKAR